MMIRRHNFDNFKLNFDKKSLILPKIYHTFKSTEKMLKLPLQSPYIAEVILLAFRA